MGDWKKIELEPRIPPEESYRLPAECPGLLTLSHTKTSLGPRWFVTFHGVEGHFLPDCETPPQAEAIEWAIQHAEELLQRLRKYSCHTSDDQRAGDAAARAVAGDLRCIDGETA